MIAATPGLVVGTEQRQPRRGDDVVAELAAAPGCSAGAEHGGGIVGQHQVAAVVARVDDRHDVRARHLRRRVDVSEEANGRHAALPAVAGTVAIT